MLADITSVSRDISLASNCDIATTIYSAFHDPNRMSNAECKEALTESIIDKCNKYLPRNVDYHYQRRSKVRYL